MRTLLLTLSLLSLVLCVQAQEQSPTEFTPTTPAESSPPEENPIPQPLPPTRYDAIFGRNPFLIKTPVATQTGPGWSENYELRGYFKVRGIETAILKSRDTNKSVKVTMEPNKDGLRLVKANPSSRRKDTTMEIAKEGENAHTFSFPSTATVGVAGGAGPAGAPGMPGVNPTVGQNLRNPGAAPIPSPRTMPGQLPVPQIPGQPGAAPGAYPGGMVRPALPAGQVTPQGANMVPGAPGTVPSPVTRRRRILTSPATPDAPIQ
jgi:hypothetical protein